MTTATKTEDQNEVSDPEDSSDKWTLDAQVFKEAKILTGLASAAGAVIVALYWYTIYLT